MSLFYKGKIKSSGGEYLQSIGSTIKITKDEKQASIWCISQHKHKLVSIYIENTDGDSLSLDCWDRKDPKLLLYKSNSSNKQKWELTENKNTITIFSPVSNSYVKFHGYNLGLSKNKSSKLSLIDREKQTSYKPLSIISYNLAFGVQKNKLYETSERVMVKRCKDTYKKYDVWYDSDAKLSQCTHNAGVAMVQRFFPKELTVDVVGIQEASAKFMVPLVQLMQSKINSKRAQFVIVGKKTCCTIYNRITMGNAESFELKSQVEGLRCGQAIFFPKSELLFLNLWFDHDKNIKKIIENLIFQKDFKPTRIIVTMDSNDYTGKYKDIVIEILGLTLMHPGKPEQTCCDDSGYTYFGDYILDSDQDNRMNYYGVPLNLDGPSQLMSDHLPVMLSSVLETTK